MTPEFASPEQDLAANRSRPRVMCTRWASSFTGCSRGAQPYSTSAGAAGIGRDNLRSGTARRATIRMPLSNARDSVQQAKTSANPAKVGVH